MSINLINVTVNYCIVQKFDGENFDECEGHMFNNDELIGKSLPNQKLFAKFVRLFHHQTFALYGIMSALPYIQISITI